MNNQTATISQILGRWDVLLFLLIGATLVAADLTQDEINYAMSEGGEKPIFFCGKKLPAMMANYCNPETRRSIEGHRPVKKSIPSLSGLSFNGFDVDQAAGFNYDDSDTADQYVNDIPRMMVYLANARRRRGITDECCRKPCTLRQLVSFCPEEYKPTRYRL